MIVHRPVDGGHGFVGGREVVDLDPVVDQLGHDLRLELLQLGLVDGVSLGDDGDYVHLRKFKTTSEGAA